jgi:lipid-binding SYLF domain-containing protein
LGFAIAKSNGDGVLLKHNDDGSWGPPSALEFGGTSAGAIFGKGKKQIFIFPMNEYGLSLLTSNTRYQLGVEIGLAIGPNGGEAEAGASAGGRGMGSTLTYTFENGVLLDIGCNNYFVQNKQKINNAFYGKEVSPTDLVMKAGSVDIPEGKGVEDLHNKLSALSQKMETFIKHANEALDLAAKRSEMIPAFVWKDCKVGQVQ